MIIHRIHHLARQLTFVLVGGFMLSVDSGKSIFSRDDDADRWLD